MASSKRKGNQVNLPQLSRSILSLFGATIALGAFLMLLLHNLYGHTRTTSDINYTGTDVSAFELIYSYGQLTDGLERLTAGDESISTTAILLRYHAFGNNIHALLNSREQGVTWPESLSADIDNLDSAVHKLGQIMQVEPELNLKAALWEAEAIRPSVIDVAQAFEKANVVKSTQMLSQLSGHYYQFWMLFIASVVIFAAFIYRLVDRNRQLSAQASALAASEAELKEVSHYRQQFMANMSHEFRTPLNAIQGFSQAILLQKEDMQRQQILHYIELIEKSSRDLGALTDNVLDLSSIDRGMLTLTVDDIEFATVIEDAIQQCAPLADQRSVKLSHSISGNWLVRCDYVGLKNCINNALDNAIKYSNKDDSVDLLAYSRDDNQIVIEVRDRGCGIPEDELKNIWVAYARSSMTRKSDREGAGLGLAITKSLVDAHNGTIEMESSEGEGTTIRLCFPSSMIVSPRRSRTQAA